MSWNENYTFFWDKPATRCYSHPCRQGRCEVSIICPKWYHRIGIHTRHTQRKWLATCLPSGFTQQLTIESPWPPGSVQVLFPLLRLCLIQPLVGPPSPTARALPSRPSSKSESWFILHEIHELHSPLVSVGIFLDPPRVCALVAFSTHWFIIKWSPFHPKHPCTSNMLQPFTRLETSLAADPTDLATASALPTCMVLAS